MTETVRMAWRNIWRSRRRTLITASAIGLGLATVLVVFGLTEGMWRHMIRAATASFLGHAQVHATGYSETKDPLKTVPDPQGTLEALRAAGTVEAAAPRFFTTGLVAIGDRSAGVRLVGYDPEREPRVTDWQEHLAAGEYAREPGQAMIGTRLAHQLEVEPGSRVVLTVSDARTGDLGHAMVRVKGVLATNNPLIDRRALLVPLEQARDVAGQPGAVHEIAMRLAGNVRDREAIAGRIAPFDRPGIEVEPWHTFSPAVARMLQMQGVYLTLWIVITFFIISLGIVNTLTMSLMERIREFGVLRAIGTSGGRLALLIFAEAASLGVVGAAGGLLVFFPVHAVLATHGINLGNAEVAGIGLDTRIHSVMRGDFLLILPPVFVLLTTIAALTTAVRAARIRPAEALRHV